MEEVRVGQDESRRKKKGQKRFLFDISKYQGVSKEKRES